MCTGAFGSKLAFLIFLAKSETNRPDGDLKRERNGFRVRAGLVRRQYRLKEYVENLTCGQRTCAHIYPLL